MDSRYWEFDHIKIATTKTVVFIDFETTGFKPWTMGRIIEYSAIKVAPNETTVFHTLAKPYAYSKNSPISIPKKITELTGISNEMVSNSPNTFNAFLEFFEFINGHVCIAHNAAFERTYIEWYCEFLKIHGDIQYRDTQPMFKKHFNEASLPKISKSDKAHMAFDDCYQMLRLLKECKDADPTLLEECKLIELPASATKSILEDIKGRQRKSLNS